MESAINKIVSGYTKWLKKENSPGYQKEKIEFIENSLSKIKLLKDKLNEAEYSRSYTSDKEYFLDSIKTQIKNRASLTEKQRAALNTMYNKFNKRIEKNKKGK
jgi:molybdopterin-biosynthesis enzyme MoeA-like protein